MSIWHALSKEDVFEELGSSPKGLSQVEVDQRVEKYGKNEIQERGLRSPWKVLLGQFTEIMVLMLIGAAVISFLIGETTDAFMILVIVILNGILGFTQEYRAERAMAALKKLAVHTVRVRRDGQVKVIDAINLVPGDVVQFEAGDRVPADCRIIESANLRAEEAALTGESNPTGKIVTPIENETLPLGDRKNMVFMGTSISYGRGAGVVVETGMKTQLGNIATMLQEVVEGKTPLQKRMAELGKWLSILAGILIGIYFVVGLWRGGEMVEIFITAVSLAVAAIPESLPAVVTIGLAMGAQRMVKRQALIRKLPAVETLGSVTVICSDKTGTLTENRMTVTILDVAGHKMDLSTQLERSGAVLMREASPLVKPSKSIALLLAGGALANDASLQPNEDGEEGFHTVGDPTEGALVVAAAKMGLWKGQLDKMLARVAEVPFTSERKRMSTVHEVKQGNDDPTDAQYATLSASLPKGKYLVFSKGAVDSLFEICDRVYSDGKIEPFNKEWRARIEKANNDLAQEGMRVLGVAMKSIDALPAQVDDSTLEKGEIFIGMTGMIDPPRKEVRAAVAECRSAGIRPVMITGDHPLTALNIARDLGIVQDTPGKGSEHAVITGAQLAEMSLEDLEKVVEDISVYARVSPEHKVKIVEALRSRGHIIAMTGDGVNDAPALKQADIGVAMGIIGTDVSKEAADMILLDDNFATIVHAIEEGRTIYENIRKFIKYTMSSNIGEIVVMLLAPVLGLPIPLRAVQLLWTNFVTDALPGLALGIEPSAKDTMSRPPNRPDESILARGLGSYMLWVGPLVGVVALLPELIARYTPIEFAGDVWKTMVFTTIVLTELGNALSLRSDKFTVAQLGLFTNKPLLITIIVTFFLQMAVVYVPFLQKIFSTAALSFGELMLSLGLSVLVFIILELVKVIRQRGESKKALKAA